MSDGHVGVQSGNMVSDENAGYKATIADLPSK